MILNYADISRRDELQRDEAERFESYRSAEARQGPAWKISLELGGNPDMSLLRIMEVVRPIIYASNSLWPTSAQWRLLLPGWFLEQTPTFTEEQYEALLATTPQEQWDQLPWDFDSWL